MHTALGIIAYWIPDDIAQLLSISSRVGDIAECLAGLQTGDTQRFVRYFWEAPVELDDWIPYAQGGGFRRWTGLDSGVLDWRQEGTRIQEQPGRCWRGTHRFKEIGLTYTEFCRGSLGFRFLQDSGFSQSGSAIFIDPDHSLFSLATALSTHTMSLVLRIMRGGVVFSAGYISRLPLPPLSPVLEEIGKISYNVSIIKTEQELVERLFLPSSRILYLWARFEVYDLLSVIDALLSTCTGFAEAFLIQELRLSQAAIEMILSETGTPAGFHPLISGYDALPNLPAELELPPLPQEVLDYLAAHQRIAPGTAELARIKARLRVLYEAGPGAKDEGADDAGPLGSGEGDEEDATVSGAHIPIPTETFLEELSVKMQLHPISVYWLLEELRSEGARCKPEELRLLEDRLSVLVLRLLGHRWPKQIEAGEPVPEWADRDGIIPIITGTGEPSLVEQVRARLRADEGDLGVQRTEALLHELTDLSLEEWLRRQFFPRHVRQFKYRPVAWHLSSSGFATGGKRRGIRRTPAFECLLYYHASDRDALTRLRTQYVEPLLRAERQRLEGARQAEQETAAAQAIARIQELEGFAGALRTVAEQGFACPELERLLADEPLDRWSGDGYLSPPSPDDLLRQERSWRVDLNDGVRVNIAPLQLAGLLVSDVLKPVDARKALADRARWRSDERRWVRAGKLPRCGWMPDDVPESQRWTDLAPQREAERVKLEEKRRRALASAEDD